MAKIPKLPQNGINVGIVPTGDDRPELWAPQPGPQTLVMLSEDFEIFFGGAKGGGKGQHLIESKVLTPFGWSRMGDLSVGSIVSNPTGGAAEVLAIHPLGEQPLYRVSFSDGASTLVTGDHLWLARRSARKIKADRRYFPFGEEDRVHGKLYTTQQMIILMEEEARRCPERDEWGNGASGMLIPLTKPVEFCPGRRLPILDPYVLGALIGDGCLRGSVSFASVDPEITDAMKARTGLELIHGGGANWRYRTKDSAELRDRLERLGLMDHLAYDKFIPEAYKWGALTTRWEITQGLMDTDGYVDGRGHCSYTTISPKLADDFRAILWSLGFKVSKKCGPAGYKDKHGVFVECQDAYTLYISGFNTRDMFKLTRKRDRCVDVTDGSGPSAPCRRITNIESVGKSEAQCITVDHPNGLYITDDFIVTHNSYCIIGWLLKGNPSVPIEQATPIDISYINCPDYRALVVRKNLEDLNSWISEAYSIYSKLGANYTQKPNEFTFPSGAKIIMGHLDDDRAAEKYFGNVVHRAAVDELTFIDNFSNYTKLYSCVRSNVKGIQAQMLLTGNPGGPGTAWVMSRFVEPIDDNGDIIPPLTTIAEREWNPFTKKVEAMTRIFIPASLKDNPKLVEKDPLYYNRLAGLPDAQRKAYLEGDWHALGGTFFPEFRSKHRDGEPDWACHVIPTGSRPLMPWLPRFASCDWGFRHSAVVYGAVKDLNGQVIIHKELVLNETGSVELGFEIGRLLLPDLEGLYKSGASPLITLWLSVDAFDKRDTVKTQAEGIAEGIAKVMGPDSVHLPEFFVPHADSIESNLFTQVKFQGKSGIAIVQAQTARIAGASHVREMLRWQPIMQADTAKFDYEVYYNLVHTSLDKAQVYFESFQRRKAEILPKMLIEDHCKGLISSIPSLVCDDKHIDDVLKTNALCDDCYDAVRYLLFSEDVADNKEPKQSFVARQLNRVRELEPNIDYNSLVWSARKAESDYAARSAPGAFSVPIESSRGAKFKKVN